MTKVPILQAVSNGADAGCRNQHQSSHTKGFEGSEYRTCSETLLENAPWLHVFVRFNFREIHSRRVSDDVDNGAEAIQHLPRHIHCESLRRVDGVELVLE